MAEIPHFSFSHLSDRTVSRQVTGHGAPYFEILALNVTDPMKKSLEKAISIPFYANGGLWRSYSLGTYEAVKSLSYEKPSLGL
jgi:hypothetical protein